MEWFNKLNWLFQGMTVNQPPTPSFLLKSCLKEILWWEVAWMLNSMSSNILRWEVAWIILTPFHIDPAPVGRSKKICCYYLPAFIYIYEKYMHKIKQLLPPLLINSGRRLYQYNEDKIWFHFRFLKAWSNSIWIHNTQKHKNMLSINSFFFFTCKLIFVVKTLVNN